MRLYDVSFFCEKGEKPVIHFDKSSDAHYPITVRINTVDRFYGSSPSITIHIDDPSDFADFCNSFLSEFQRLTGEVQND